MLSKHVSASFIELGSFDQLQSVGKCKGASSPVMQWLCLGLRRFDCNRVRALSSRDFMRSSFCPSCGPKVKALMPNTTSSLRDVMHVFDWQTYNTVERCRVDINGVIFEAPMTSLVSAVLRFAEESQLHTSVRVLHVTQQNVLGY